jgi:L-lactate dehydrogenase complex protein LldG
MSARENILARIRQNSGRQNSGRSGQTTDSGRSSETTHAERDAVRAHIAAHTGGPLPAIAREEALPRFISECERLKSTVDSVENMQDVPQAVLRYLTQNELEKCVVAWVSLADLNWSAAGIVCENRIANKDDLIGITDCFCAIGETGTLLLLSSAVTPKLTALLPETHVCIVSRSRMVNTMEEAFQLLRAEKGSLPRATFFVSGPSRTADIEQTIVIGAHGPYRVHVILVP